jgi:integrase
MIAAGETPNELMGVEPQATTVGDWLKMYRAGSRVSAHDADVIGRLPDVVTGFPGHKLTVAWALSWVSSMHSSGIAPGTIRKKVGALARCLDWCKMAGLVAANPVRELPRNYAAYPDGHVNRREDDERDRRLLQGEEDRIRQVLVHRYDWLLLFDMGIETAMRMREMFTMDWGQVSLEKRTVFLEKTKNGDRRQVPMSSTIHAVLAQITNQEGRLFPWWDGDVVTMAKTTARLSHQWARIARDAGCVDLRFHDLRHEATCRLYERTTLSDIQIARITGHKSLLMLKRYANLRGSDLALSLW